MLLIGFLSGSSSSGTSADSAARLIAFNHALAELGSHPLSNLTTPNTRLHELDARWESAINYVLAQADWNFARARATLTTASSGGFPPYTKEYAKPSNYLRKCWIRAAADDEFQIDHAETAAKFFGFVDDPIIEFISNSADNRNPANWPPQFTRAVSLYLAFLVAPKLARAGDDVLQRLWKQFQQIVSQAQTQESVFSVNGQVATERLPVIRRGIEIIGQIYAGHPAVLNRADYLRWQMNKSWTQAVRYCLEQAAWNFATKRAEFTNGEAGEAAIPSDAVSGIIEGYSVPNGGTDTDLVDFAGWQFGYPLPTDFRHKIWIKADANIPVEIPHQILRDYIFCNYDPAVLEYIAEDSWTVDPDNWPATFVEVVASCLAMTVAPDIMESDRKTPMPRERLERFYLSKLADAKVKDAVQQYPVQPPAGSFARARHGSSFSRRRH